MKSLSIQLETFSIGLRSLVNTDQIWLKTLAVVLLLLGLWILVTAFYNLYLHPLCKFPGPKAWIAFPLLRHIRAVRGLYDTDLVDIHNKCGDVVRVLPNELNFVDAKAWTDIYGANAGLPKAWIAKPGAPDMFSADDPQVHRRFRRVIDPAFSDRGIRQLEPMISRYVTMFLDNLEDFALRGDYVDVNKHFNLLTFDLIGKLTFGEDFNGLRTQETHTWVATVFNWFKMIPFMLAAYDYPLFFKLLFWSMPKSVVRARDEHDKITLDKTRRRVDKQELRGNGDFIDHMMAATGTKDEFSFEEMVSNATVLMVAGSETTATTLCVLTYYLLKNPSSLARVKQEVREMYTSEEDITLLSSPKHPLLYLQACIDECHRLHCAGVSGLPRWIPQGESRTVSGVSLQGRIKVGVHHTAAYWNERHFHSAKTFSPERWLPEALSNPSSPFYHDDRAICNPFGIAPRNCVGRNFAKHELRYVFSRLVWNFDIVELGSGCSQWHKQRSWVVWEKPPLPVLLKKREF